MVYIIAIDVCCWASDEGKVLLDNCTEYCQSWYTVYKGYKYTIDILSFSFCLQSFLNFGFKLIPLKEKFKKEFIDD